MTPPSRPTSALDTEPIAVPARSGRVDTLEIPVTPPPAAPQISAPEPPAPLPQPQPAPPAGRRRGMGAPALAAVAFLAAGAGVVAGTLGSGALDLDRLRSLAVPGQSADDDTSGPAAGAPLEPVSVVSVDPSGGSGFQSADSGGWRTQTYTTAEFGNLKDGVGLLVDLGTAQEVGTVSLTGASAGLSVELRAGDDASDDPGHFEVVDTATTGGAATDLSAADAEASRYWLVWVTELAPSGDGFAAGIEDLGLRAEG